MRVKVEFQTMGDIQEFNQVIQKVDCDVRLIGTDENGNPWDLSAKSLLSSLIIELKLQKSREHTAHEVDWNTIYCECEKDIYSVIEKFIVI